MNDRSRNGFTLIELLVTVVIIGILAGLIMTVASKAWDKAKSAKCAANMSSIYRAYVMRTADEQKNYRWIPIRSAGWAGVLLAYVDGKEKIFRCPMDKTGHWGGANAMFPAASGVMQLDSGRSFGKNSARIKNAGGVVVQDGYFEWGPEWTVSGMPEKYLNACAYVGTPGSALWQVRVASGESGGTAFSADTYGFTIFRDTQRLQIDQCDLNTVLLDGKGALLVGGTNLFSLRGSQVSVGMVRNCSYGMNDYDIEGGVWTSGSFWMQETYSFFWPTIPANKVILMDYTNAQVAAHAMASNAIPWGTNAMAFTRHASRTRVNVLFGDGSVKSMTPAELDPGLAGKYDQYWQPACP